MAKKRLALIAALALALAPGTWLQSPVKPNDPDAPILVTPIAPGAALPGELRVVSAWRLSSPNRYFGGFSALLARPERLPGRALAIGSTAMRKGLLDPFSGEKE